MEGVKVYKDFFFNNINKKTNLEIVMEFYNKWKRYEASLSRTDKLQVQDFSETLDKFVDSIKDYSKQEEYYIPIITSENPIPEISEKCPSVGTQGYVQQIGEGWIFVFENDEGNTKSLFVKQTNDKKLEVYAKDTAYNQSWFSLSTIQLRKPDFTCNKFIDFIDDDHKLAILVEKKEANEYPEIKYPEPPKGWGWKVWFLGALASAILLYSGYNNSTKLLNLFYTSGLSRDLFYAYCVGVANTLYLPISLVNAILLNIKQFLYIKTEFNEVLNDFEESITNLYKQQWGGTPHPEFLEYIKSKRKLLNQD